LQHHNNPVALDLSSWVKKPFLPAFFQFYNSSSYTIPRCRTSSPRRMQQLSLTYIP